MVVPTKPVRRLFELLDRRGVVVTLYPKGVIGLRIRKTRREYFLTLAAAYRVAVDADRAAAAYARVEAKRAKKIADGFAPAPRTVSRGLLSR